MKQGGACPEPLCAVNILRESAPVGSVLEVYCKLHFSTMAVCWCAGFLVFAMLCNASPCIEHSCPSETARGNARCAPSMMLLLWFAVEDDEAGCFSQGEGNSAKVTAVSIATYRCTSGACLKLSPLWTPPNAEAHDH